MKAYEGNKPYIFVSYAHKDSDTVLPILEALSEAGYRIWYDAGIEVGADWPEYIGNRLKNCNIMLAFVSPAFDKSRHCRNEINLGINKEKSIVVIYLEEFELSAGMELQLGTLQSLYYYDLEKFESLVKSLMMIRDIERCLNLKGKRKNKSNTQIGFFDPISLKDFFEVRGLKTIDLRHNKGCLWVLGDRKEINDIIQEARRIYGIDGGYASGRATEYKPAWWTKSPL